MDNLGSRLKNVRVKAGWTLRELARRAGVSPSFVSQIENGKSQPSVATLYEFAQLLNVSIDELFDPTGGFAPRPAGRAGRAPTPHRLAPLVDPTVGFVITVNPGDKVVAGEPIASVFARDPAGITLGFEALGQAIVVADKLTTKPLPLVSHRVTKAGVEELTRPDSGRTSRSPR